MKTIAVGDNKLFAVRKVWLEQNDDEVKVMVQEGNRPQICLAIIGDDDVVYFVGTEKDGKIYDTIMKTDKASL